MESETTLSCADTLRETYATNKKRKKWYKKTYKKMRNKWLLYCLLKLDLPIDFKLANLSANYGKYEKEVYLELKNIYNYTPTFYLGDLLKDDDYIHSFDAFYYNYRGCLAQEVTLPEKVNVVLDFKGALWYLVKPSTENRKPTVEDLLKLLEKYYELLLDDTSLLIIDGYKNDYCKCFSHNCGFQEKSTYLRIRELLSFLELDSFRKTLDIIPNETVTLSSKLIYGKKAKNIQLHFYTKIEIKNIIDKIREADKIHIDKINKILQSWI